MEQVSKAYVKKECQIDLDSVGQSVEKCKEGMIRIEDAFITVRPKIRVVDREVFFSKAQIDGKTYASKIEKALNSANIRLNTEIVPKYAGKDSASILLLSNNRQVKGNFFEASRTGFYMGSTKSSSENNYSFVSTGVFFEKDMEVVDDIVFSTSARFSRHSSDNLRNLNSVQALGTVRKHVGDFSFSGSGSLGIISNISGKSFDPGFLVETKYYFHDLEIGLSSLWSKSLRELGLSGGIAL